MFSHFTVKYDLYPINGLLVFIFKRLEEKFKSKHLGKTVRDKTDIASEYSQNLANFNVYFMLSFNNLHLHNHKSI